MRTSIIVVTATLATLGTTLSAAAAHGHADRRSDRHADRNGGHVSVEGTAFDWDADAGSLTLDGVRLRGGPRALRRAVREGDELDVGVGPRTRLVTEDDEGVRTRVTPGEMFAALDDATGDVTVEGTATLPVAGLPDTGAPAVTGVRIVVHLPAADEADPADDADPADEPSDDAPAADGAGA